MREIIKALRPETLFGSVFGFLTAAALAFLHAGMPPLGVLVASLVGLIFLHMSMNLIFYAVNPGGEQNPSSEEGGGSGKGALLFRTMIVVSALIIFLAGLALGLWLAEQDRPLVFLWGFGGVAAALLYTLAPPWFRRLGPGQAAVLLGFGPLLTLGVYYVLTGRINLPAGLIGLPQGLLLVAVLWADPIMLRAWDRKRGEEVRTHPGKLGRYSINLWSHLGLFVLVGASLLVLVGAANTGVLALLGLAVAPLAFSAAWDLRKKGRTAELVSRARAKTIYTYLILSLLLIGGLVGERFLRI